MGQYVTFLLNLAADGEDRTIAESVALAPSTALPSNGFHWKVICDGEGKVFVIAPHGKGCEVIATARHRDDALVQRLQQDHERVPEWEADRGKKLCVTGVIESIERRDRAPQDVRGAAGHDRG